MAQQLWVKFDNRISGPYTAAQLRKLAERGQLKPEYQVSTNQKQWCVASSVKGLCFPCAKDVALHQSSQLKVHSDTRSVRFEEGQEQGTEPEPACSSDTSALPQKAIDPNASRSRPMWNYSKIALAVSVAMTLVSLISATLTLGSLGQLLFIWYLAALTYLVCAIVGYKWAIGFETFVVGIFGTTARGLIGSVDGEMGAVAAASATHAEKRGGSHSRRQKPRLKKTATASIVFSGAAVLTILTVLLMPDSVVEGISVKRQLSKAFSANNLRQFIQIEDPHEDIALTPS